MAPETFKAGYYNAKYTDIWAIGATLFYFLTGRIPFPGKSYF